MNIANWLCQTAQSWPNREAVRVGPSAYCTYSALLKAVCNRASDLKETHQIRKGDRIAIFAKNNPDYIELLHACWWIGAVAVPINAKLHPTEARWIINDSGASVVFTDSGGVFGSDCGFVEVGRSKPRPQGRSQLTDPAELDDNDLAWLFYTSGTTGRPKGAMLSHANLRNMAMCYTADVDCALPTDAMLYAAPMSHGAGLYMFSHIRVAALHIVPGSGGFDSDEIIELAKEQGSLVLFAAPTMVKRLVATARARQYDGTGIRTIVYGGGPMYLQDIDEAVDWLGPRFVQIYGQGESPMTISALSRDLISDVTQPNWHERRSSVGVPQSCVEVRILNEIGQALPRGQIGEICVRSPTVMLGYWQNEPATKATIRDGWLHTGDLGYLTSDGFLYLTDRSKDVIISGGTNIYPREVEDALLSHPAVFEVAVVGEPDPEWGEQVVAHIVLKKQHSASPNELDNWCKQHIASFKKPKKYIFSDDLPKNNYGKILKSQLRQKEMPPQLSSSGAAS